MYLHFDEISFDARLWIYQADRPLTDHEVSLITQALTAAIDGWEAHNHPLLASAKVFYHRFVIIAVDEAHELPSGCSIDKSVHWLQELGQRLGVDFFDRSVVYLDEAGHLKTMPVAAVKQAVADEEIRSGTLVFDNLVATKAQWMKRWKVPADRTWMKRFFKEQTA
ncbi:MAG: hypothetical protein KKG00_01120 [Bacteroidetes bacterium]|nr:hypothetical protein [Bacteroidota bacterium]